MKQSIFNIFFLCLLHASTHFCLEVKDTEYRSGLFEKEKYTTYQLPYKVLTKDIPIDFFPQCLQKTKLKYQDHLNTLTENVLKEIYVECIRSFKILHTKGHLSE